jgi:neutral ceramidase
MASKVTSMRRRKQLDEQRLYIGTATIPIPPPLGIDMMGFVNRSVAGLGYDQPMEVQALIAQSGSHRVALLAVDMALCPVAIAVQIREKIAIALDCPRHAVLLNINHSHALPGFIGDYKLGGACDSYTQEELRFADDVEAMMISAARQAANHMEEAVQVCGSMQVEGISVNRRERTADGRTILGWNPDGVCDRSVQAVWFKRKDESVITTIVNFACHPVILGRDIPEYSSDYIGAIRTAVKQLIGGECMFLQGAAGNILPLEAFLEYKGKEVEFGKLVAMKAVEAIFHPIYPETVIHKHAFGSVTPISMYRKHLQINQGEQAIVDSIEELIHFPLQELLTQAQLLAEIERREQELSQLKAQSASRALTNPIQYHIYWARTMLRKIAEGTYTDVVVAPLQAIRIGGIGICAAPGEIFNEIGIAVKERSQAKMTLYAGYSNGLLGYFATAEEYPHRGYEPYVSHRGFSQPAPFDPQCEQLLIDKGSELINRLFST